jgi:ABC-type phosphate transport system ATPase subunit
VTFTPQTGGAAAGRPGATPGDPSLGEVAAATVDSRDDDVGGVELLEVSAYYRSFRAVRDVSLRIRPRAVTAIIGPSGCGKSTLLRVINRMHETIAGTRVEGAVRLDGIDVYDPAVSPVRVRRTIGMVFQKRPACASPASGRGRP